MLQTTIIYHTKIDENHNEKFNDTLGSLIPISGSIGVILSVYVSKEDLCFAQRIRRGDITGWATVGRKAFFACLLHGVRLVTLD
jgi:hypothetical protein